MFRRSSAGRSSARHSRRKSVSDWWHLRGRIALFPGTLSYGWAVPPSNWEKYFPFGDVDAQQLSFTIKKSILQYQWTSDLMVGGQQIDAGLGLIMSEVDLASGQPILDYSPVDAGAADWTMRDRFQQWLPVSVPAATFYQGSQDSDPKFNESRAQRKVLGDSNKGLAFAAENRAFSDVSVTLCYDIRTLITVYA